MSILLVMTLVSSVVAQEAAKDTAAARLRQVQYDLPVPEVRFNNRSFMFQSEIYPEFYKTHSVLQDLRWVRENDSALAWFWEVKGDSILWLLTQFSGLDWVEDRFDLYVLRYYPSFGGSEPFVIPVGGMRRGEMAIAAPQGAVQEFNLIYHLAHRMLAQAEKADDPLYRSMAAHPLMQPGPYRRDNLAMLLALVTSQTIIGLDSTFEAYQSEFWRSQSLGREIFEKYLLTQWVLVFDHPLVQWLLDESPLSALVEATRAPASSAEGSMGDGQGSVEGIPIKGQLGFAVSIGDNNRLTVNKIDTTRLGYACGLREGDIIRAVDGKRPRNHRQLVEFLLVGLDRGGATLSLLRNEVDLTLVVRPGKFASDKEDAYRRFQNVEDTLIIESTPPDTGRTVPPPRH
ncbi:MAG: PDZ domain-containing protein [Candidatus Zixiibacteriota bacterium]